MKKKIAVIHGDGIGPEIMEQALKVLDAVAKKYGHKFTYLDVPVGGNAYDTFGDPLPKSSLNDCLEASAVLLSAVGGPKWDNIAPEKRPEQGLLRLRSGMEVFANIRPTKMYRELAEASPLKTGIVERGIDFVVVRELIGGIYFGEHETREVCGEDYASDIMGYSVHEIERIAHVAFATAKNRRKRVCSVDKANVLDSSKLWRRVVNTVAKQYPDVELSHMYVDNCAMQIVRDPSQFDVILTENLFGDILSDEASMITGSIGMIPSASLGESEKGLYEPIHGSAPDIAGLDKANPSGMILAVAMMLRHSFNLEVEAQDIENAVSAVLKSGCRTADTVSDGKLCLGCRAMGQAVCEKI